MIDPNNYCHLGSGRHREVYLLPSEKHVIKIPTCTKGEYDNQYEFSIRHERPYYANCRIIPGTNFLIMEYVQTIDSIYDIVFRLGTIPSWVWTVDNVQVGFNSSGKLLVFDYGFY